MDRCDVERVVVCVTREKHEQAQILVQQAPHARQGASIALPGTALLPGEHPAEAAYRVLKNTFEQDVCPMFHKLAQVPSADGTWHIFQTAPEKDLPELINGHEWRAQSEVPPQLAEQHAWSAALNRLG